MDVRSDENYSVAGKIVPHAPADGASASLQKDYGRNVLRLVGPTWLAAAKVRIRSGGQKRSAMAAFATKGCGAE